MPAPTSFDRSACRCCPSCAATEYTSTVWVHSRAPNFANWKDGLRTQLPFNKRAEEKAGIPGWNYGMLRSAAYARMLEALSSNIVFPGHKFVRF